MVGLWDGESDGANVSCIEGREDDDIVGENVGSKEGGTVLANVGCELGVVVEFMSWAFTRSIRDRSNEAQSERKICMATMT